jgi:hypothetical protein
MLLYSFLTSFILHVLPKLVHFVFDKLLCWQIQIPYKVKSWPEIVLQTYLIQFECFRYFPSLTNYIQECT